MDVSTWVVLVSAIGTTLFTALASGGIFFAARQLHINAWARAQEIFTDPCFTETRTRVFSAWSQGTEPSEQDALEMCRQMDGFARVVPFLKYLRSSGENEALRVWDDPIYKSWDALEKFVKKEREKTGWTTKWDAFERLGKKAFKRVEKRKKKERK